MAKKEIKISRAEFNRLMTVGFLGLILAACDPVATAQETRPAVTQTIDGLNVPGESEEAIVETLTATTTNTPEHTATPENTPTTTATATPEATPTPEFTATPEAMTQEQIRAEILAAGVNLDDLASSTDEWTSSYMYLEDLQDDIDHNNFGNEAEGFINTVVIGLEGVENLKELDQALLTDGGWKLTSYAKLAYKDVDGNWQIIKVPLSAYNLEDKLIWPKDVSTRGQFYLDANKYIHLDNNGNFDASFLNYWTGSSIGNNYHWGTGSFIKLFTGWPENPRWANNDAVLGDLPRYSEEQLIEFRKTGDPSIFGYQDSDGYYIFWPIVTFNADISALANYNQD